VEPDPLLLSLELAKVTAGPMREHLEPYSCYKILALLLTLERAYPIITAFSLSINLRDNPDSGSKFTSDHKTRLLRWKWCPWRTRRWELRWAEVNGMKEEHRRLRRYSRPIHYRTETRASRKTTPWL
jgi:hypothetical protein